ncbi:TonB-dependent receptor [Dyadobacter chenwenxiniae]|uniref:TonB-dependent receptor n=1 Tax=Dyadobacter chenwenxiniae TaxID=2906456 RepID=A0A9X1PRN9_9BACT|nr:TonB-dependent receptor [Dyadobacter chenwenxiniae]MCF0064413.1 TonB-dependent receptor [Dyadobacter chenwenxiniae]UON82381.1 TonB-dependent receptor [Dyadobacter chenwenxiniae]
MKAIMLILCVFLGRGLLNAQDMQVSGRVTDKNGAILPAVSIQIKGTNKGILSDETGSFKITFPMGSNVLVFSLVGFVRKEIKIENESIINVVLNSDDQSLAEVLIVGYGTEIKRDLTGNIASIKGSEVANTPVANFTQALQGRAAGVFIESNSGKLGEGIKVRIRGTGSISASNEPLYVIDGIPINAASQSGIPLPGSSATSSSVNPLADINTNDIESFEILKDASAAAIYGSRAANGVVLITTKKGKSGKTSLIANFQYGINRSTGRRKFLDAKQYISLLREAATNSDIRNGLDPTKPGQYKGSWLEFAEGRLDRYSGGTDWRTYQTDTDWQKLAFNNQSRTRIVDIGALGGNEKTRFYINGSYNDQDGILVGNDFQKLSARLNLEHDYNSKLKFGLNIGLSRTVVNRIAQDNQFSTPMQVVALAPITPPYDKNGAVNDRPVTTYYNPLIELDNSRDISTAYRNIGNAYLSYNLTKGLAFRTELGFDLGNQDEDVFYGVKTEAGQSVNGQGTSFWNRNLTYNTNNYFNYSTSINARHTLDFTVGMSFQEYKNDRNYVTGHDFPVDALKKIESAGKIVAGSSSSLGSSFLSYFARSNYKLRNRYLFTVSGRIDGSSRFGKNAKYGFFPAVSTGWIISEEPFLSQSRVLSFLKLRGSWGITGNADGFGDFKQLGLWGAGKYAGSSGLVPTQLANPDLKWEKSKQIDFGIDFGIFNNRFSGEIDYYSKNTNNLIYDVPVPGISGFATQTVNIGSMQNKGIEIVFSSTNLDTRLFKWNTSINLSKNTNKVTKLDGEQNLVSSNDGRFFNALKVGESIGIFYGPKFAGVDRVTGDALYYVQDGKVTNDYNAAGNFTVGNPNPDWIGGITNSITFTNFELSILFQGVFGNQVQNGAGAFMSSSFDWFDNQTVDQLDRWQKEGDITNVPQLRFSGGNGTGASSRFIFNASYVRLKNITLAYRFSNSLLQKIKLSTAKLYITAINLATFTKYPGWDPEVNADYRASNRNQGGDFYSAPQIKSLTLGINLEF